MKETNNFINNIFIVNLQDPKVCDFITTELSMLKPKEILIKIEKFGLTSNNITYAALKDSMPYFKFFPIDEKNPGWGCLPVWGVGKVIQSNFADLAEGTCVYGFFPAANYVTLEVAALTPTGFIVNRPNIAQEYGFYNLYNFTHLDPFYLKDKEDMMAVVRPLFLTGLLIADYLEVNNFMQANTVIISSAASKTSYALALALHKKQKCKLLGLASAKSKPFAESMNIYDQVITYEEIKNISEDLTAVYIDICGNELVRGQLISKLSDKLKHILSVGMTNWKQGSYGLPKTARNIKSEVFFAPGWTLQRPKDSAAEFAKELFKGWHAQMSNVEKYFQLQNASGKDALRKSFLDFVNSQSKPERAYVFSL